MQASEPGENMGGGSYSAPTEFFTLQHRRHLCWRNVKLIRDIQLAADGNSYTATVTVEILDVNGNVIVTLCATEVGDASGVD